MSDAEDVVGADADDNGGGAAPITDDANGGDVQERRLSRTRSEAAAVGGGTDRRRSSPPSTQTLTRARSALDLQPAPSVAAYVYDSFVPAARDRFKKYFASYSGYAHDNYAWPFSFDYWRNVREDFDYRPYLYRRDYSCLYDSYYWPSPRGYRYCASLSRHYNWAYSAYDYTGSTRMRNYGGVGGLDHGYQFAYWQHRRYLLSAY